MLIHNKTNTVSDILNIYVNKVKLTQIDHVKYLGVWIDETLKWHHHVNTVCKNLNKKLGMLSRVSKILPLKSLLCTYKSFISPSFDYADTIWHPCNKYLSNKIQILKNRAARIICNNFDYVNTRGIDLVKQLKHHSTYERREYNMCTLIYKCIHGKVPNYLCDNIIMACDVHKYGTRQAESMNLYIPNAKNKIIRDSLFFQGANLWNSLPSFVKESPSIESFKRNYLKIKR